MFEHFGIKDIFYGLWKFKCWILAATLLMGVAGSYLFAKEVQPSGEKEYYYSQTWYFKDSDKEEEKNEMSYAKTFNGLLESNECKSFVKNAILEQYTEEDVLAVLGQTGNPNGLTWDALTESMSHLLVEGEEAVSMAVKLRNEDMGRALVNAYDQFVSMMEEKINATGKNLQVVKVGESEECYVVSESGVAKKEAAVLGAMIGFVVSCIVVFFVCLFVPTLNRKSDFDQYGLLVLGDVKEV